MSKFSWRTFASLLLGFTFPLVLITGLVLWLAHSPQTFGIGKGIWKHTHIWASLLMSVAAIVHFVFNWSVFWSYIRRKGESLLSRKLEFALALGIVALLIVTAVVHPDEGIQRLAGMNLAQIADGSGKSVEDLVAILKKGGIAVRDPNDSLREIAEHNNVPVQQVATLLPTPSRGGSKGPGPR
jgi:hypothetical protein